MIFLPGEALALGHPPGAHGGAGLGRLSGHNGFSITHEPDVIVDGLRLRIALSLGLQDLLFR